MNPSNVSCIRPKSPNPVRRNLTEDELYLESTPQVQVAAHRRSSRHRRHTGNNDNNAEDDDEGLR